MNEWVSSYLGTKGLYIYMRESGGRWQVVPCWLVDRDSVPGICCFMTVDTVVPLTSICGQGKLSVLLFPCPDLYLVSNRDIYVFSPASAASYLVLVFVSIYEDSSMICLYIQLGRVSLYGYYIVLQ